MKKGKRAGQAGPSMSRTEEDKFQEPCLCPEGIRSWFGDVKVDGLEAFQSSFEGAVGQVKATTMVSRNKKKCAVPDEMRKMTALAAQCRDLVSRKVSRKKAQTARREFEAKSRCLAQR